MVKRGTRVTVNGKPGVVVGSWFQQPARFPAPRHGTLFRRVRLDDGQIVYARETELEAVTA